VPVVDDGGGEANGVGCGVIGEVGEEPKGPE
jgi:hypothetical protein